MLRGLGSGYHGSNNFPNFVLRDYLRLNKPLSFELGYSVGLFAIYPGNAALMQDKNLQNLFGKPELAKIQSNALLSSLYNRATMEHGHEQLAGIVASVIDYDIGGSQHVKLSPLSEVVCDNCGTGGDRIGTFHISTIAAFIAAAHGMRMAKHGSPGNARQSGSSDMINALGIDNMPEPNKVERAIDNVGFAYIEALDTRYKSIHVQTHEFARFAHMNDIIGPMTNPVDPSKLQIKLLGTNAIVSPITIALAYKKLNELGVTNIKRGLFVRGYLNGDTTITTDEVSIMRGGTEAALLDNGRITKMHINFSSFGFEHPVRVEDIRPRYNTKDGRIGYSLEVINGNAPNGAINTLLANSAAIIALNMEKIDFIEATKMAETVFKSGGHIDIINSVKTALPLREEVVL